MGRASQGMAKKVVKAKIACLDMNLQKARMHMGVQVSSSPPCHLFCCIAMHLRHLSEHWSAVPCECNARQPVHITLDQGNE